MNFKSFSAISAIFAGLSGLAYSYFFIVAKEPMYYSLFLMLMGLFGLKVAVYLYTRLKEKDEGWALVAAVLMIAGSLGSLVHGGYDLANTINPPANMNLDLPSQVDPRGLLAFGLTGLGIIKFSFLMNKDKFFPGNLAFLGVVSGILLVIIYLARLTVLSPTNPILLYPVLIEGFLINPIWYFWLGMRINKS